MISFRKERKLTEILTKKWQLKNDILYANERIYISSKKLRNALFKQNSNAFYAKHFEYEKKLELIRRKYWWLKLIRNVKRYFKLYINCHRIKFRNINSMIFRIFINVKRFLSKLNFKFHHRFFLCRFLNEIYDNMFMIVNRFTKYAIYISIRKFEKKKSCTRIDRQFV